MYSEAVPDNNACMEDTIRCVCGRLWHIERHLENLERRGRIYCRCNATLANDEDGSMDAHLLEPRERMPEMRRLLGQIGLAAVKVGCRLRMPATKWVRLSRLNALLNPNKAGHIRAEVRSSMRSGG